jgi:hypothetical protein
MLPTAITADSRSGCYSGGESPDRFIRLDCCYAANIMKD